MKFAFYTLGCKVNQYETQAMAQLLTEKGHTVGDFGETCDGYIINTCSVTAVADKKNRAVIRRCRRDNPEAVIGVCGCYSQIEPEAAEKLGAAVIFGAADRIAEISFKDFTRCVVIRMRAVPAVDATAMNELENLYDRCLAKGIHIVFSHVNEQPMHTMEKAGFIEKVGRENFCPHIDDALARAAELAGEEYTKAE